MRLSRLLLSSLTHYWRTNLAVWLGVVAATAVLGGAFLVGDSVRGSLRQITLARLGQIDHVVQSPRFFREALAAEIAAAPDFLNEFSAIVPAIVLEGSLKRDEPLPGKKTPRAGQVQVYGLDAGGWTLTDHGGIEPPRGRELILSSRVAQQLQVQAGDKVTVWVELPRAVPRDSLLGKKEDTATPLPLTVKTVLPESSGVGRLGMQPNQQLPLNAFVALPTLQEALELAAELPSRTVTDPLPDRVNALFVSARSEVSRTPEAAGRLNQFLAKCLQLADLDLRTVPHEEAGYVALESRRMILETTISDRALALAWEQGLTTSPVLVYLANEITSKKTDKTYAMYSVIAGLNQPAPPPFGPFEWTGAAPKFPLGSRDIVLNDWLAADLQAEIGDIVTIKYFLAGSRGELPEVEQQFTVRGITPLGPGTHAADRGLTPEVRGITDARTLGEWEQPFPMQFQRITKRDEDYWEGYRATPKAFINLAAAQDLWRTRYGSLTSIRVAAPDEATRVKVDAWARALLPQTEQELGRFGLAFTPVKAIGLAAARGSNDFSVLFISFSFFLIFSATILIGLLFRLGVERRGTQVGVLLATGFSPRLVSRLLLGEGLLVVLVGAFAGLGAAIAYAWLMLYGLRTIWVGAVGTSSLELYVTPLSLLLGFGITVAVAMAAIWWALRAFWQIPVRALMAGVIQPPATAAEQKQRGRFTRVLFIASGSIALLLIAGVLTGLVPLQQAFGGLSWRTVAFFMAGLSALTAGLTGFAVWIAVDQKTHTSGMVRGGGFRGVGRLGVRNAARFRARSTLTVGLIAFATFVIVAVAAGERNPARMEPDKSSGNGGFTLVAESAVPLLYDLGTPSGRDNLDLTDPETTAGLTPLTKVIPFRVQPGEEASCLNLYQTQLPTILGVPQEMIERGGFKFVGGGENPWKVLNERRKDGRIPVFGDMNTLMYSLHKGPGATVGVPNDDEPQHRLEIAGMLDGSVFQGVLLMSENRFLELFPERKGYQYFLLEVEPAQATAVSDLLETRLDAFGFDAEPVGDRLRNFLMVQNTYLETFRTLGGLGLLLGTCGLAAVMLRNVLERRSELALMRAVGFRNGQLAWLVLSENALLLAWGLGVGTGAALLAMMPHLVDIGADIPVGQLLLTLGAVFLTGMVTALLAVVEALRTPVLATLRAEA